ncbi:NGG1p interacting factor NIF3 [Halobacteriovorax sp. YZS-1-1]|uniref:NGG1p interacting factor NIF3 n=1 Tax=unclassified Halobacteriovorax TaxID=2639665 RepID=UPI00399B20A8
MKKLVFFVPVDDAQEVKEVIFNAGAGTIGNYDKCSFETEGIGQFRPNNQANPHIGESGIIEKVRELKVETICPDDKVKEVIKALRTAHPYEEPAIDLYELVNF